MYFFQFGEMPYHLVRSRRFKDLYEHVLFNYQWLHAKLSSCPLQAVLADFEDASMNADDKDSKRELMLVAGMHFSCTIFKLVNTIIIDFRFSFAIHIVLLYFVNV